MAPVSGPPVLNYEASQEYLSLIKGLHGSSELILYYKYEKNGVFSPPLVFTLLSCVTLPHTLLDQSSGIIPGDSAVEKKKLEISFSVFIPPDDGRELKDLAHGVGNRSDIHVPGMKSPPFFFRCKINLNCSRLICRTLNAPS